MATSKDLYGLYDLGGDGTILYSNDGACRPSARPELVGRNFFEDVSGFDNMPVFACSFIRLSGAARQSIALFWIRIREMPGAKRRFIWPVHLKMTITRRMSVSCL